MRCSMTNKEKRNKLQPTYVEGKNGEMKLWKGKGW